MHELTRFEVVSLTLEDIVPNEDTHRYSLHPDFDGLKESISIRGLESPLVVTLNPDSAGKYSIYSDGNSRLEALNELYTETGDARFFNVDCVLHPWTGRLACVLRDLAAISTQGEKTHLDNSLEIYKAKELYELELGKKVSLRELSQYFDDQGILIGKDRISYSLKTIDIIFPAFPTLLEKGLGSKECRFLISMHETIKNGWDKLAKDKKSVTDSELQKIFINVAECFDGIDLYIRVKFISHISVALSEAISLPGITPLVWANIITEPSLVYYLNEYSTGNDGVEDELEVIETENTNVIDIGISPTTLSATEQSNNVIEADPDSKDRSASEEDRLPIANTYVDGKMSLKNEEVQLKAEIFNDVYKIINKIKPNQNVLRKSNHTPSAIGYEIVNIPSLADEPFFKFAAAFTGFHLSIKSDEMVSLLIGSIKDNPILHDDEFEGFINIIRNSRKLRVMQRNESAIAFNKEGVKYG